MRENQPPKASWLSIAIALGAVAGVLAIVVFVRSGERTDRQPSEPTKVSEQKRRNEQVQERLQALHEARAHSAEAQPGEQGAAPAELPPGPKLKNDVVSGHLPAVESKPGSAAPGAPSAPLQVEPIPFDEDPDDIPTLTRISLQDPDPERRLAAVTLLGASDDPSVIPTLARALSDQDEDVRLAAVQSLSDFTGEAAVDAVQPALNDQSADIRYEALEVLSDLDPERARPFVERALTDSDEEVRGLAESLLDSDETSGKTPAAPAPPARQAPPPPNG